MALTAEMIKANDVLANLTEEQISAITTLSTNEEDVVIGKRFGEVYRELDATIEKTTGIKREGAEKTYNYLERATKAYADKFQDYDTLKGKISSLETEKEELNKKLLEGGDSALKGQLETIQKELTTTKGQFNALQEKYTKAEGEHAKAMENYKIQSVIDRAKNELKLKEGLSEIVKATLIEKATANVMALNPSFEDRNGVSTLIFHNEDGSPLNNEKNKLNPFTAKELLEKEFGAMDLLEKGSAGGAGGKAPKPNQNGSLVATTKSEADNEIHKMLSSEGLVRGTSEYQDRYNTIYAENKVSELPN